MSLWLTYNTSHGSQVSAGWLACSYSCTLSYWVLPLFNMYSNSRLSGEARQRCQQPFLVFCCKPSSSPLSACTREKDCLAVSVFSVSRYRWSLSKWYAVFFFQNNNSSPSFTFGIISPLDIDNYDRLSSFSFFLDVSCICVCARVWSSVIFHIVIGHLFIVLTTVCVSFVIVLKMRWCQLEDN